MMYLAPVFFLATLVYSIRAVRRVWASSLFNEHPRICECSAPLAFDGRSGHTLSFRCTGSCGRTTVPIATFRDHECRESDLQPVGLGHLEDGMVIQPMRCRTCGRKYESVDDLTDLALGGI